MREILGHGAKSGVCLRSGSRVADNGRRNRVRGGCVSSPWILGGPSSKRSNLLLNADHI